VVELAKLVKGVFLGILNVVFIWTALFLYSSEAYLVLVLLLLGPPWSISSLFPKGRIPTVICCPPPFS